VNDYLYDGLHRLTQVTQHAAGGNAVAAKRASFTYDALSRFDTITRFELDSPVWEEVAESTYDYDFAGQLKSLNHASATTLADYDWVYDRANRITQFDSWADGTADYDYDNRGQLTSAVFRRSKRRSKRGHSTY
jgi:YD repeat-containing protein